MRCVGKHSKPEGPSMKKETFAELFLAASPLLVLQHMRAWSKAILFLNHVLAMICCTLLNYQEGKLNVHFY